MTKSSATSMSSAALSSDPGLGPDRPRSSRIADWYRRATWVDLVMLAIRVALIILICIGLTRSLAQNEYSRNDWISFGVFGLTLGSIYALVSLGYTMVYGVLRMINFAHGDVFMAGAFGAFIVSDVHVAGQSFLILVALLAVGAATSAAIAIIVERTCYRPFQDSRNLAPLICAIGASFILQYTVRGLFGTGSRAYRDLDFLEGSVTIAGYAVPFVQLIVIAVAIVAMILLHLLVSRTRLGRCMRAVAEDRETAALMGINSDRVITITFAVGGAMAGIAGVLYALVFKQIHAFMGFSLGIKGFAAAVLGGIGNIPGAMAGGILLGLGESFGPAALLSGFGIASPYQLKDAIAYGLLVIILIFRPQGIFGERLATKRM